MCEANDLTFDNFIAKRVYNEYLKDKTIDFNSIYLQKIKFTANIIKENKNIINNLKNIVIPPINKLFVVCIVKTHQLKLM